MKRILIFCAAALVLAAPQTYAGVFSANFNDCITVPCAPPAGSTVRGTAVIEPTGGVGDSGVLKLTKALPSQQGAFVIEDLDAGQTVNGFDLRFKLRMGGGGATPADGFSFSAAPDLPADPGTWGEEGTGGGLSVVFDIYANEGETGPHIDIKWPAQTVLRHTNVPISFLRTTNAYVDVQIRLDTDGSLDLVYNGTPIYTDLLLPGFQPTGSLKYGFGGRTGGAVEDQWIDDLQLTTTTGTLSPRFLRQPADATVREGGSLTLRAEINDPTQVFSYAWFRRGPTDPGFTAIAGAADTNYTAGPLTLADSGSQYVLRATTTEGEFSSRTATVSVVSIPVPPATTTFNFDDGVVPPGTAVYGTPPAVVTIDGGVGGSGVLRLTEAVNGQSGTFIINDLNAGQAVEAITVSFRPRVGGSTARPPADGFSFSWANNLPDANFALGEEGAGTGLTVTFDIFEGAENPVVEVKFGGTNIAAVRVPLDVIETGDAFGNAIIQLRADGRVYVVYNDVVLHNGVQIPGWSAIGGARYAFAARTGGLNEAHYIDDIGITTTLFSGPLSFTRQPANVAVVTGQTATFSAEVNDPARSTFQWQAQASGGGAFTNIPGATASTYVTPALVAANNGTLFRLMATGPINTVTSDQVTLTVVNVSRPTAPDVTFNFNDCTVEPCAPPAGTMTNGTARITPTGGTAGSGVLHITDALNDQNGSWVIEDFMGGQAVGGFTLAFNAYIDDGTATPADGYSVSWGTDIPNGLLNPAEEGAGTGLIVAFDLWNSSAAGQPAEAPAIDIKWRGQTVVTKLVPTATIETGTGAFKEVLIRLEPDGTVDVVYGGELIHNNVAISNHTSLAGARFVFAGRTGGANENQWIDDVAVDAVLFTGPITFIQEPADTVVLTGSTATFSATVNDPARSTFQWQARAPGGSTFTNVPGATSSSFTTPALVLGDSGTDFRLIATAASNTLTSRVARLTVITIDQPTPTAEFDFDDGLLPPGTAIVTSAGPPAGAGTIDPTAGVNGTGGLKLTVSPGAGHVASFIVEDLNAGAPVYAMTASFDTRIGGGTTPPADGMSFVWASDLPNNAPFGEDGLGSGLTVTFDIYDNGNPVGEAPAIDVTYRGVVIASTKVPIALLDTGDAYVPTIIRVENDGTLDVVYDNQVIYHNLALPGFTNVVGGRFGWGARTGGLSANQWIDNIQIATSTTAAARLTISHVGNNVTVSWNAGQLQSAPAITGPWTTMAGATSPLTLNNTTGMQFFRTISP